MIKVLDRCKFEIEKAINDLAKQDFRHAVDRLIGFIGNIDYMLEHRIAVSKEVVYPSDLKDYGLKGIPGTKETKTMLLTEVKSIENLELIDTFVRFDGIVYRYDKENKEWFVDSAEADKPIIWRQVKYCECPPVNQN